MSEKKIVAQYTLYVYNTGEVKLVKKEAKDLLECSSSIRQIIGIINHVVEKVMLNVLISQGLMGLSH